MNELGRSLSSLVGVQLEALKLSRVVLASIEPSQVGTIVGTLMDASLSHLGSILPDQADLADLGLKKHQGLIGEREGYPDFEHNSGKRLELKLLYVDPVELEMKRPPTDREASARLTQKVTVKNVKPDLDVLLILAYQLRPDHVDADLYSPTVIDIGLFPMIEAIRARDFRLEQGGGKWFGDYETPTVLSKLGTAKKRAGRPVNYDSYGRKESEGHDLNEDTNFGKLKRIPYRPLQLFLQKHGASYTRSGRYPAPWTIAGHGVPPGIFDEEDELP
jgi:hypothetical protein